MLQPNFRSTWTFKFFRVADVFVAKTSPVNLHGHRKETFPTKDEKEGYGHAQDLV